MAESDNIGPRLGRGYYAEVFAYGEGKVVKLFDDGRDAESANHEAQVTTVARESGIPAPKIYDVVTVNDRAGIVMERIDGENMIQWGTSLPWRVYTGAKLMARLHVDMHSKRGVDIPAPQEEMLDRIQSAPGVEESVKLQAAEQLATLPDGDSFCHGDFHPGNILMAPGNPVIIDWEGGASAHPASDVAKTVVLIQSGVPLERGIRRVVIEAARKYFLSTYLKEYFNLTGMTWDDVSPWLLPAAVSYTNSVFPEHLDDHLAYLRRFV